MLGVKEARALDAGFDRLGLEIVELIDLALNPLVEAAIFDQGNFDRFDQAGTAGFLGLGVEESEIVDDGKRHREGADPVLFAEGIDGAFDANSTVVLG